MWCERYSRPSYLSGDNVNHGNCILDAYNRIVTEKECCPLYFLVLLANTTMISSSLIDSAFQLLSNDLNSSGVLSCWKAGDDHPSRALTLNHDGYLSSSTAFVDTNRQSYNDVYYYDQGVWLFKASNLYNEKSGPGPWWWMGNQCQIIERE